MLFPKKMILLALFVFVFLSVGAVSAANDTCVADTQTLNDTYAADAPTLNDTGIDLTYNHADNVTQVSLNDTRDDNASSTHTTNSSVPSNSSYFHSMELSLARNLVDNYGSYNIDELASIYNIDSGCIKTLLQFIRCGVYGSDLKNTLNHKDYVLNQQIKSMISCQPNFSKLKGNRGSNFKSDVAEKIVQMYGKYSVRQMATQLMSQNVSASENDILLILYHVKMNDGRAGYGTRLQGLYNIKEQYLNETIPKLQSYVIKTDSIAYTSTNVNASNIVFTDVDMYSLMNTYTVRVVDQEDKAVSSGHVSFFVNGNLAYVCKVNEKGQAVFYLNDVFKSFGQYTITCMYSNIVKQDIITIGNITQNEFFKAKALFEGIKVYDIGDLFRIKFVSTDGKNLTGSYVRFSINNEIIGIGTVDDSGIASCQIHSKVKSLINSKNCFIKSELYDDYLNDYLTVMEHITINARSLQSLSSGSMLPKWRDTIYEICDDGYHMYIDENNYQLIEYDGTTFLVHVENINNAVQLKSFFETLSSEKIKWDIVIINLAHKDYDIDFHTYSDREWDYALKFAYGQLIINGNGATFVGDDDLNFMTVCNGANVMIENLKLKSFNHCFYNRGMLYCSKMDFISNFAYKLELGIADSGAVIHNFNTAEFNECLFDGNDAQYNWILGVSPMGGSILFAEPHSTTYFYHNYYSGKGIFRDSIFASKYSSVIITPQKGDTDWTWKNFIGNSFIHPLATITMVNPKETIADDYYANRYNPIIFNCSNNNDLLNAFKSINIDGVMGSEIIINLVNTTYSFSTDFANKMHNDWGIGYRGTFFSSKYESYKDFPRSEHHYFINAGGFIPITINGNGAHIKITGNDINDDYHFAFVGKNGKLTLNDLMLSGFNTVFFNSYGSLICNNCDISNNKIEYRYYNGDDGGVLRSYGGSSIFEDCKLFNNRGTDGTDFAYVVDGSYLELVNCTISQHYSKYATLKDSLIKCSSDLYKNHIQATSTTFICNDAKLDILYYKINNESDLENITSSKIDADNILIDFNCNCSVNLNKLISHPGSIYIRSNGYTVKITSDLNVGKYTSVYLDGFTFTNKFINNGLLSLMNCTLNGYNSKIMFENSGQCLLSNCVISENNCENVFENKGSISFISCYIKSNTATEYGIIYNNGGSVVCVNDTFVYNSGDEIYNFQTANCAIINSTVPNVIFKEPLSKLTLDLIQTGALIVTIALSYGFGYLIGSMVGMCIQGMIISAGFGALFGGVMGLVYGGIEAETLHDYSHFWSRIGSFAVIGVTSALVGYSFGSYEPKLEAGNPEGTDSQIVDDDFIERSPNNEANSELGDNDLIDNYHNNQLESDFGDFDNLDVIEHNKNIELEDMGNRVAKKFKDHMFAERTYNQMLAEMDKDAPNINKINQYAKELDTFFQNNNFEEFGQETFKYLHSRCLDMWKIPNGYQNKIINQLEDYIRLYAI